MRTPFDAALLRKYTDRGLVTDATTQQARAVHLPTECPKSTACWKGEPDARKPAHGTTASQLSAPFIGPRYDDARLLIVLENLRDYGGLDMSDAPKVGMRFLGGAAIVGLRKGHKVLFDGDGYAGTRVWYQAARYAATWLGEDAASGSGLAAAMERVAIAQHVKCSPRGGRSEATHAMFEHCGAHVLAHEIEVLAPRRILVLGTGRNRAALAAHVLRGPTVPVATQKVRLGRGHAIVAMERAQLPSGSAVDVLYVPHPARPGGTARALVAVVASMVT